MKTLIIIIGFLFVASIPYKGIGQYGTGLIIDEEALLAIPTVPDYGMGGKSGDQQLGGLKKVDLRPYCPEIQHQGRTASCVGWAVGYGAFTMQKAIDNGWEGQTALITDQAYSAMFIYNQIRQKKLRIGRKPGKSV